MATKKNTIEPSTWYTLSELVEGDMFPWCGDNIRKYRRIVLLDKKKLDHLKTVIVGRGRTTRYKFKGENIIKFIELVERGAIRL